MLFREVINLPLFCKFICINIYIMQEWTVNYNFQF
jgi:hypothetical protein